MVFSRSLSRVSPNLLRELGYFRRPQCRRYTGTPNDNKRGLNVQPLLSSKPLDSHTRSWTTFIIPAGLLLFAGAGILVHYNDERRAVLKGQGTEDVRGTIRGPVIGGPFSLIDTEHRMITERDLLGSWVLLYFGYTSSPDVGPAELQKMAKAIDILESEQKLKVLPIFVTMDPERDSPSHLKAYLREFDPRIVGLTGPSSAIKQMAHEYRVFFKRVEEDGDDYLIQTSHNMYLLDPNMEIVRCFGVEYDAEQLSKELLKEISRPSKSTASLPCSAA